MPPPVDPLARPQVRRRKAGADVKLARYNRRALAVLTISDHILTGEALPADQRETSFGAMVEVALQAAFA